MRYKMTTKTSPPIIKIKKELPSDEIKDFAETAMNELLGWYGYDNVDRMDTKATRLLQRHRANSNGVRGRSLTPEKFSSRENSKSPMQLKIVEKLDIECAWCRRPVLQNSTEVFGSQDGGPRYCSESCFAQSRRASFKRAKTCDWCRHVRHAVSYVDFQDGASQLQFCSDKCLNQYKMQIFCKETQAHLDMNPHLKDNGKSTSGNLITPELWLKNCKSRSISPKSDRSCSPSSDNLTPAQSHQMSSQKPLITVAPPSKLMNRSALQPSLKQTIKPTRKRRSERLISSSNNNSSNNNNNISNSSNSSNINNNNHISNNVANTTNTQNISTKPCTVTSAQDLRINMQPQSEKVIPTFLPGFRHPFLPPPPNIFAIRPTINNTQSRFMPPLNHMPMQEPPRLPSFGTIPPVTILVPYPIIIPLPIPIPIPLPLSEFINAARKMENNNNNNNNNNNTNINNNNSNAMKKTDEKETTNNNEEPLDCTKAKDNTAVLTTIMTTTDTDTNSDEKFNISPTIEEENKNAEQKLPKFKITRLHSRRILTRELESSRPLRKRKRPFESESHK